MNRRVRRRLKRSLLVCGALLLVSWLVMFVDGRASQLVLSRRLEALGLDGSSPGTADAARAEAKASGLVGRIEIPRLGLSAMVLEGTGGRALHRGVGHLERSAFPGEPGNVVLAGHRDTYFRELKDAEVGDLIRVTTPDGKYAYRVDWIKVVKPDRSDLIADTPGSELTLVTCYPFYWVGPAPKRFVIRASPAHAAGAPLASADAPAAAPSPAD